MTTAVDFCFVDPTESDEPVELERFYFTIFDVDQQRKESRHSERLCVDSDQYDSYVLAGATSLDIEERDVACDGSPGASTTFASTSAGFECDNPTDAQNLGEVSCSDCAQCAENEALAEYFPIDQSARSVMFVFKQPRDCFRLVYGVPCDDCFLDVRAASLFWRGEMARATPS